MTVAFFPKTHDLEVESLSRSVLDFFVKKNISVVVEDSYEKLLEAPSHFFCGPKKNRISYYHGW